MTDLWYFHCMSCDFFLDVSVDNELDQAILDATIHGLTSELTDGTIHKLTS